MLDVIGIDSSVVDHIISIDRLPKTDEEISMLAQSWQGGGKVATALAAASRLGGKAGLMGVVADDDFGDFIINDLIYHGVDTSHMRRDIGKVSNYCISLAERATGGRSFIAHWATHRSFAETDIDEIYIRNARALHLYQLSAAEIKAACIARAAGVLVSYDADEYSPSLEEHLDKIDILIGSAFCYSSLFKGKENDVENNLFSLRKRGPSVVIFTFGEKGCAGISEKGEFFSLPAYPVNVLDSTGAGDVFHGAFLYHFLNEEGDGRDAACFASAVSAIKCTCLGGRAGIPSREMVSDFMETGKYNRDELKKRSERYAAYYGSRQAGHTNG